jgi:pyroglutamyl-peptidase
MILLTAFEPFGGSQINASWEAAARLAGRDSQIALTQLPVVIGEAERVALEAFHALPTPPKCFIALGEAGPERVIHLEKVARNVDDFRMPDNAGNQVDDTKIRVEGPDTYLATVDVEKIEADLAGTTPLPVQVSLSAGAFLCNHLAYQMLDSHLLCPFLFIHVPSWRPDAYGEEDLDQIVETLEQVINSVQKTVFTLGNKDKQ